MEFVYFVQSETSKLVKIGITAHLEDRLKALESACGSSVKLLCAVSGTRKEERAIHKCLEQYRKRGEWFEPATRVLSKINTFRLYKLYKEFVQDHPVEAQQLAEIQNEKELKWFKENYKEIK